MPAQADANVRTAGFSYFMAYHLLPYECFSSVGIEKSSVRLSYANKRIGMPEGSRTGKAPAHDYSSASYAPIVSSSNMSRKMLMSLIWFWTAAQAEATSTTLGFSYFIVVHLLSLSILLRLNSIPGHVVEPVGRGSKSKGWSSGTAKCCAGASLDEHAPALNYSSASYAPIVSSGTMS